MNTLISMVIAILFIVITRKSLRRYGVVYYVCFAAISIWVFVSQYTTVSLRFPEWFRTWVWPLFYRGGLAGALFIIIMWTGALPNGSKLMRVLMPIRGELSIIASILTLGHNAATGMTYFKYLFKDPMRLPLPTRLAACCSLIMIAIMLPLFITSFKCIRRRMVPKKWKKLQRLAYVFYALLFMHLMLLYVPMVLGGKPYLFTVIYYCVIYVVYAVCRIWKAKVRQGG